MNISDQELQIFSRQLILKEFDENKFNFIQKQHVIIIGMGGIGCPLSQYLLTSGIKNITLIDDDKVHITNLNRQILYTYDDLGKNKVEISKKKLANINPHCSIKVISKKIDEKNIRTYLKNSSIIVDATDNWKSMNIINKYCVNQSIPLVSTSVIGFDGQVILFKNSKNSHLCLNCIYPINKEPNLPRCDSVGVLGIAAGLTGLIAAQSIINFLINKNNLNTKLLMINSKTMKIDHIKVKRNNNCINIPEKN